MMKKTKVLIPFLLIWIGTYSQSNLVRNSGFEESANLAPAGKPDGDMQIKYCRRWKQIESPEWYSTVSGYFNGCYDSTCTSAGNCGQTNPKNHPKMTTSNGGVHYAGFAACEGIQQKLYSPVNALSYVQIDFLYSPRACQEDIKIRVYLLNIDFHGIINT